MPKKERKDPGNPQARSRGREEPIPADIYPVIDTDLARDNLENDLPAADLEDLKKDTYGRGDQTGTAWETGMYLDRSAPGVAAESMRNIRKLVCTGIPRRRQQVSGEPSGSPLTDFRRLQLWS